MKKIILALFSVIAVSTLVPQIAAAREHGGQCLNTELTTMKDCNIIVDLANSQLEIRFKSDDQQSGNFTLNRDQITTISTGQYAETQIKKIITSGILSGPTSGIISLFDKENRTQFTIEYVDDQNQTQITLVDLPTQYSLLLKQELRTLTGLSIQGEAKPE